MITITQQGLEEVLRYKVKASLTLEYLSAKTLATRNDKTALFFASLISSMANANGGVVFIGVVASRRIPRHVEQITDNESISWLQMGCQTQISPEIRIV